MMTFAQQEQQQHFARGRQHAGRHAEPTATREFLGSNRRRSGHLLMTLLPQ